MAPTTMSAGRNQKLKRTSSAKFRNFDLKVCLGFAGFPSLCGKHSSKDLHSERIGGTVTIISIIEKASCSEIDALARDSLVRSATEVLLSAVCLAPVAVS